MTRTRAASARAEQYWTWVTGVHDATRDAVTRSILHEWSIRAVDWSRGGQRPKPGAIVSAAELASRCGLAEYTVRTRLATAVNVGLLRAVSRPAPGRPVRYEATLPGRITAQEPSQRRATQPYERRATQPGVAFEHRAVQHFEHRATEPYGYSYTELLTEPPPPSVATPAHDTHTVEEEEEKILRDETTPGTDVLLAAIPEDVRGRQPMRATTAAIAQEVRQLLERGVTVRELHTITITPSWRNVDNGAAVLLSRLRELATFDRDAIQDQAAASAAKTDDAEESYATTGKPSASEKAELETFARDRSKMPPCPHGTPGGDVQRPVYGTPSCADCRSTFGAKSPQDAPEQPDTHGLPSSQRNDGSGRAGWREEATG